MRNNSTPYLIKLIWDTLRPTLNVPSEKVRLISDFRQMIGNALFGIHIPHNIILFTGNEIGRLIHDCLALVGQNKVMKASEDILRDADTFHHACIDDDVPTLLLIAPKENLKDSDWETLISSAYGSDTYNADDLGDIGVQVHPVICMFADKAKWLGDPIEHMDSLLDLDLTATPPDKVNFELARKMVLSTEEIASLTEWFSDAAINIPVAIPNEIAYFHKI